MNSVDRVKAICKERKIAISKLEKDLGFSNAYISQLRKGNFRADRLQMIADYLNVTAEYLMTGEEKAPTETSERQVTDEDIKFALFRGRENVTDEMYQEVRNFADYIAQREDAKNKEK